MSARNLLLNISLSVIDDLGLRLYSSTPAVLSEIVANSWDADASEVKITLDAESQSIKIEDDGEGMSFDDALNHFLKVGYRRRESQPVLTLKNKRRVMGRKGIGKLAPLAIADEVEIETRKDGSILRFLLDVDQIRKDIAANLAHEPRVLEDGATDKPNGTVVWLRKPRKQVQWAVNPLRKRLALRFAVLGPHLKFNVVVNGTQLTPADVDYYDRVELAWSYGLTPTDPEYKKLGRPPTWFPRDPAFKVSEGGQEKEYLFKGWLATVEKPSDLEDNGQSFGSVIVFARGKLVHEDATALVNDDHIFTKYLVGEIYAEFVDVDELEDIATSSRQGLIEADPRVHILCEFLKQEFKHINKSWSELRADKGGVAVYEIPAVKQYLDGLLPEPRKKAQRFLGKIWSARDIVENTAELLKSGILFCENLRVQESLDKLEHIDVAHFASVQEAFELVSAMEATQYHQLVRARMHVIEAFQKIVGSDEKEKVLQLYIAKHLWLLNPSWDVIPTIGAKEVEKSLGALATKLKGSGSQAERDGRLDIFYSRTSNTHIIIELKRYSARPNQGDLINQIARYKQEVRTILDSAGKTSDSIEVFILLGNHPGGENPTLRQEIDKKLDVDSAKIVLYDELINKAQELHAGYLKVSANKQQLQTILSSVESSVRHLTAGT